MSICNHSFLFCLGQSALCLADFYTTFSYFMERVAKPFLVPLGNNHSSTPSALFIPLILLLKKACPNFLLLCVPSLCIYACSSTQYYRTLSSYIVCYVTTFLNIRHKCLTLSEIVTSLKIRVSFVIAILFEVLSHYTQAP